MFVSGCGRDMGGTWEGREKDMSCSCVDMGSTSEKHESTVRRRGMTTGGHGLL